MLRTRRRPECEEVVVGTREGAALADGHEPGGLGPSEESWLVRESSAGGRRLSPVRRTPGRRRYGPTVKRLRRSRNASRPGNPSCRLRCPAPSGLAQCYRRAASGPPASGRLSRGRGRVTYPDRDGADATQVKVCTRVGRALGHFRDRSFDHPRGVEDRWPRPFARTPCVVARARASRPRLGNA